MQSNSGRLERALPLQCALLFYATAVAMVGCASVQSSVRNESQSIAARLGFPQCDVSVALSPSEVIEYSKKSGNPRAEENVEWIKMAAELRPDDKLRLVNCLGVKGVGDSYYYALFRNNEILLKFHPMIFD